MSIKPYRENLSVVTKNVIPSLKYTPYGGVVNLLAGGSPAVPVTEFTVTGTTITWAGIYDINVGEIITVFYDYDDGSDVFDASDTTMNPLEVSYNLTVIQENIVPKLIHTPVSGTLSVTVNSVRVNEGIDWSISGRTITWLGSTLSVGSRVGVIYRRTP